MGIQGLLPLLKSIMAPIHIKELEGCCVAVDTYSWLHKGALSCSKELCKGLPTSRHIQYCMHRVNLLRHYGVKPILVFDGGFLPMKMDQENKRARSRKENLARALEHEANGNSSAAYECYQKAVDISPSIAHDLIQVLKRENVSYVVAPYEADAQMTFLAITNQVDAIITEDSDLIPFGCPRIIFKMDKFGHGVEFQASMLHKNKELNFAGFSKQMILEMCILSGCDYLQSLSGLGLKRAHALITKFKSFDRVIKHLKYSTASVPPLYEEAFKKAILTFKHQRVYDPKSGDIVHLSEISDELGCDLDFLGPLIPQHIAKGIAEGNLDPLTNMPFQGENVSSNLVANVNSLPKSLEPGKHKKLELPVQKNLLTKYFCFASLEAKRKFMAPRVSPKCQSQTDDSSGSAEEQVHVDAGCREAEDSSAPSSQSQKSDRFPPSSNFGENGSATAVLENPQSSSIELLADTTVRSNKDADYMNVREEESITISDQAQVIVTSRYFQHKSCEDKILKSPCLRDCSAMNKNEDSKSFINDFGASGGEEIRKTSGKSRYFQQKEQSDYPEYDQFDNPLLNKSYFIDQSKNAKGTTQTERGKVVVRSKYFQQKPESKNNLNNEEEEDFLVKKVPAVYTLKEAVHPSVSPGNRPFEGLSGKRKSLLDDSFQKENMNPKHICRTETHYDVDDLSQNIPNGETNCEAKFGSNISHISNYSKIAEESVERFASAISSFRYNSSGSRASGLRAPLKNIHKASSNSSSGELDLSKFVYNPSKSKPKTRLPRF